MEKVINFYPSLFPHLLYRYCRTASESSIFGITIEPLSLIFAPSRVNFIFIPLCWLYLDIKKSIIQLKSVDPRLDVATVVLYSLGVLADDCISDHLVKRNNALFSGFAVSQVPQIQS